MSYVCKNCKAESEFRVPRCPICNTWGEYTSKEGLELSASPIPLNRIKAEKYQYQSTGVPGLDSVLGGGFVSEGLYYFYGAPGTGKSTLLLQIAGLFKTLYITGEESAGSIKLRANRLGVSASKIYVWATDNASQVFAWSGMYDFVIWDSLHTLRLPGEYDSPGATLTAVEVTRRVMHYTRARGCFSAIIGHVNKDGGSHGAVAIEHLVDTPIKVVGDDNSPEKIFSTTKNRYGPAPVSCELVMSATGFHEPLRAVE